MSATPFLRSTVDGLEKPPDEELYAEQGAAAFTSPYNASARAIVGGDYFDCAMCHEGDPVILFGLAKKVRIFFTPVPSTD